MSGRDGNVRDCKSQALQETRLASERRLQTARPARGQADIAQLVERQISNLQVAGSNPAVRSIFYRNRTSNSGYARLRRAREATSSLRGVDTTRNRSSNQAISEEVLHMTSFFMILTVSVTIGIIFLLLRARARRVDQPQPNTAPNSDRPTGVQEFVIDRHGHLDPRGRKT